MANLSGGPGVQVDGPTCLPPRFGLLSVAEIEDKPFGHWMDGFHHDQLSCDDLLVVSDYCEPHVKTDAAAGVDFPESTPFTLVAGYECATAGDTLAVAWDRAEQRLNQGESRSIERTFWTGEDSLGNEIQQSLGQNPDVVDITPLAGASSITGGLALLEDWAGENMSCLPIIHTSKGIAVYLAERGLIAPEGDVMYSNGTGSRVAVGGGYNTNGPSGGEPSPGEGWIFITGSIKVTRSPMFFTPDKDDPAGAVDRAINNVEVFAERTYGISLRCGVAAVRVTLESCC